MKLYQALCNGSFRSAFDFGGRDVAHWFPGHMAKGLKQMRANLKSVDCIIEIHDARISSDSLFQETLGVRPHLLVLNKMDLADMSQKRKIHDQLHSNGIQKVLFTDCLKQRDENVKKLVPKVMEILENNPRFNRDEVIVQDIYRKCIEEFISQMPFVLFMQNLDYCLMVIGVPNVGKSSLINSLRRTYLKKGRASRVGGEPGITKAVLTKIQVCERPLMHLLDTPGVLPPKINDVETGMKLALCTILDHLVGEEIIADYLLYSLNRLQKFKLFFFSVKLNIHGFLMVIYSLHIFMPSYVERYDLQEPCDDIQHVLKRISVKLGKTQRVKAITGVGNVTITVPNYSAAAYDFIRAFRKGELGRVMLD
ncbi:hypothetical protein NQD34_011353 [Periophthalmus magnuspinnatus]|nr:hypothetical protein NQD34_011353 [Periophthalmus magnuspinnatus]